jgi:hypothetical protein
MFRAGLYARVSTNDRQTLPMQSRAMRICRPAWLEDRLASPAGELRGATRPYMLPKSGSCIPFGISKSEIDRQLKIGFCGNDPSNV